MSYRMSEAMPGRMAQSMSHICPNLISKSVISLLAGFIEEPLHVSVSIVVFFQHTKKIQAGRPITFVTCARRVPDV